MNYKYLVVYEHTVGSFSGFVPDIPGCITSATTLEEMRRNMREAIACQIDSLVMEGSQVPKPATFTVHFPKDSGIEYWVVELIDVAVPEAHSQQSQIASTLEG